MTALRIAAVDLGSNSFHLVVVEAHPDGSFDTLAKEREVLRLGDAVARTGRIGETLSERAVDTMRRFVTMARGLGADEIVACATAAIREAEDSAEVCDAITDETGVVVEVISGTREAQLVFSAVRRSIAITDPPAVCLDLGGGSLEIAVGDQGSLFWSTSLRLGVGRLATEHLRSDPPSDRDLRRVREAVGDALVDIAGVVTGFEPRMLIGTSGTLCDLARVASALASGGSPPMSVNQLTVSRRDLVASHRKLVSLTAPERARLPGLDARRADQIPAGSVVLLTAMKQFGLDELTVGEWALREGMLLEAIARHEPADWTGDAAAVRRASVAALARRCGADDAHSANVARLAAQLFDGLLAVHGLGHPARELLEHGAVLHDIGEHVAVDGHHKHTAYLIEHGRLRGFRPDEVDVLAVLGRYHRRSRPSASFEPWRRLDAAQRRDALALLAMLRIADGLDRGHAGAVDGVDCEVSRKTVRLLVSSSVDVDLELWGVRRKRDLFQEVFERQLELVAADHPAVRSSVHDAAN